MSGDHLKTGPLGTADVTASTVANIGPGIDFYFAFGVIAVTAGVAAPLTIIAAGAAVLLLAFTMAEFTRAEPSAGSFITYVGDLAGIQGRRGHGPAGRGGVHRCHRGGVHDVGRHGGAGRRPLQVRGRFPGDR